MYTAPSTLSDEVNNLKKLLKQELENTANKVLTEYSQDINSRIKILTHEDFNGRFEWFILPKETKNDENHK